MAKKSRAKHPLTRRLLASLVDDAFLDNLHERGLVSDRSSVRPPKGEVVPYPKPNEVVIFVE